MTYNFFAFPNRYWPTSHFPVYYWPGGLIVSIPAIPVPHGAKIIWMIPSKKEEEEILLLLLAAARSGY